MAWVKARSIRAGKSIIFSASSQAETGGFSAISISISIDISGRDKIIGLITDSENDKVDGVIVEDVDVTDGKWNHVAFSFAEDFYRIFINGEVVEPKWNEGYIEFIDNNTPILVASTGAGNHYIDEVGFFERGFSPYEIKGLYNDGLSRFMRIMPVTPEGFVTTTWTDMKAGEK